MTLHLPAGKTFALALSFDFDGESLWLAKDKDDDYATLSKGQYCGDVAAPRLLRLLERFGIRSSWGIPTHTYRTWPELSRRIRETHEVFCHGVCHEKLAGLTREEEERLLADQVAHFEEFFGHRPRGYRAPSGPTTPHTLELLDQFEFVWDSSLAGGDLVPYHPRKVLSRDRIEGTRFGEPHKVLEFSTTVHQEDWFSFEFEYGVNMGMMDPDIVFKRWRTMIEWGMRNEPGGALVLTLHPQSIGRPYHVEMFERFLEWVAGVDELWTVSVGEIAETWRPQVAAP